ncbi:hypothetical protein PF008_g24505 [Phytophthora fragariae]|uniref:Uncharacterized protein n=1 Tax=Phytophthora fragariae TaxID=53985 RepID=A0A6G0QMM2_9STRA|nr:hypothetical protein PF008_g24505 [Phytophthora fragariae]
MGIKAEEAANSSLSAAGAREGHAAERSTEQAVTTGPLDEEDHVERGADGATPGYEDWEGGCLRGDTSYDRLLYLVPVIKNV